MIYFMIAIVLVLLIAAVWFMYEYLQGSKKNRTPRRILRPEVKLLIGDILNNPENWKRTQYTIDNKKTGIQIWTANNWENTRFYPDGSDKDFTDDEKKSIREAVDGVTFHSNMKKIVDSIDEKTEEEATNEEA